MDLRRLNKADVEVFRRVRLQGMKESPQAFSSDFAESVQQPIEHFAARLRNLEDDFVIGAFVEQQLVGIGGFYRDAGPKLRHKGTIWGVYILPEHRREGVGRRLVSEIIAQAAVVADIRQINIVVTAANAKAREFYLALGFEPWGLEPRALWIDGAFYDDQHMVLFLPGRS